LKLFIAALLVFLGFNNPNNHIFAQTTTHFTEQQIKNVFANCMQQDLSLSFGAFQQAIEMLYQQYNTVSKDKLIIVDYSQPSTQQRFYFIDLKAEKLLLKTYVAHGLNSGDLCAERFSNVNGSYQTSLGMYRTAELYCGKYDLSIRLDGLEPGKNCNVRKRDIVIHRAAYANESYLLENGKLGRSLGCLALPENVSDDLIEQMAAGVGVYVYWCP
jgi:hypothetical protein